MVKPPLLNDLLIFSEQNPWQVPAHSKSLQERFLTALISSEDFILDLRDKDSRRMACAVVLDLVQNPSRDACLEILGARSDLNRIAIFKSIIEWAIQQTPSTMGGLQVSVAEERVPELEPHLLGQKFIEHYIYYDLENHHVREEPVQGKICAAVPTDAHVVYSVMCEAFRENPETSIPNADVWIPSFLTSPTSHFYLFKERDKIVGFLNLIEATEKNSGEIRTLGVLPEYRSAGIGRKLLHYALNQALKLGFTKCHLSVAVANDRALGLYLRAGFAVVAKFRCYRRPLA